MITAERVDRAFSIASNAVYVALVATTILILVPGLRRPLQQLGGRILFDWRYGLWLASRPPATPLPAWVRQAAQRPADELPAE